jgi:hypothetical protein
VQLALRARHGDIEQATFLLDLILPLGVLQGKQPIAAPDEMDYRPLQSLGSVDGCQGHATGDGGELGGGTFVEVIHEVRQ